MAAVHRPSAYWTLQFTERVAEMKNCTWFNSRLALHILILPDAYSVEYLILIPGAQSVLLQLDISKTQLDSRLLAISNGMK